MAHYPTLTYSQFRVFTDSLPAELRLPPNIDASLPPAYSFELEQKVLRDFEAAQASAASERQNITLQQSQGDRKVASGMSGLRIDQSQQRERNEKLARMKELVSADTTTCLFYLDSQGWDIERAVSEFFAKPR